MITNYNSEVEVAENFHRGENSQELSPSDAVAQFVANRSQGVIGEVHAAAVLANGLARFKKDATKLQSFLDGLRDVKVLSQAEATALAENKSAARVSKLKKIAGYKGRLLDDRICPWLTPGYTCLYELVLLIEEIEKGQQGLDRVVEILSECDGEISKSWLTDRRKKLRSNLGLSDEPEQGIDDVVAEVDTSEAPSIQPEVATSDSTSEAIDSTKSNVAPARAEKVGSGKPTVAALLMTVTDEQADQFGKELGSASAAPCVKVSNEIDANAVLLIDAKAGTLLSMPNIIGSIGFDRCVRVGVLPESDGFDITSSRMVAVYVRGSVELPTFADWQRDTNPAELAARIVEGVGGRRVHLFATSETDGWESVVGDANWQR